MHKVENHRKWMEMEFINKIKNRATNRDRVTDCAKKKRLEIRPIHCRCWSLDGDRTNRIRIIRSSFYGQNHDCQKYQQFKYDSENHKASHSHMRPKTDNTSEEHYDGLEVGTLTVKFTTSCTKLRLWRYISSNVKTTSNKRQFFHFILFSFPHLRKHQYQVKWKRNSATKMIDGR
jgi:hypothetical protein